MEDWLCAQLDPLGLNDPDIVEYLIPILEDEDEEIEEVIESCEEFLVASMPDEVDLSSFLKELQTRIEGNRSGQVNEMEEAKKVLAEKREKERQTAAEAEIKLKEIAIQREKEENRTLTAEEKQERKRKRKIAAQYDGEMALDANGDFVYTGVENEAEIVVVNSNVERIATESKRLRDNQKKKHMEKKVKDKEDLEKDKSRKDKSKKKTVKKEKRRGNG